MVYNRRLHLFWPIFIEKSVPADDNTYERGTADHLRRDEKYWEIKIAWSEYKNNKWSAKQVSPEVIDKYELQEQDPGSVDPDYRAVLKPIFSKMFSPEGFTFKGSIDTDTFLISSRKSQIAEVSKLPSNMSKYS